MAIGIPPGAQLLETDEAVRRIQERDHVKTKQMPRDAEDALIVGLRAGWVVACLMPDGQIAFRSTEA